MPTIDKLPGILQGDISSNDILAINSGGKTEKITLAMLGSYFGLSTGSRLIEVNWLSSDGGDEQNIPGATDTWEFVFQYIDGGTTTNSTFEFEIYNGANGSNGTNGRSVEDVEEVGTALAGDPTVLRFLDGDGVLIGRSISIQPGARGLTGAAAGVGVPTYEQVDFGQPLQVSTSGPAAATVFDFKIPKGEKGDPSTEQGPQGSYYVKIFRRSATDLNGQAVPANVTWLPSGLTDPSVTWSLTVPAGTDQLWEAELLYDPATLDVGSWSSIFHAGAEGPAGAPGSHGTSLDAEFDPATNILTIEETTYSGQTANPPTTIVDLNIKGEDGDAGAPGDPVDNVVEVGTSGIGDPTVLRFEVQGAQVGADISIQPGNRGQKGEDGDPGEGIEVGGSSIDGAGNTTVVLEGITSGADRGSFLVQRGLQGIEGPVSTTPGPDGEPVSAVRTVTTGTSTTATEIGFDTPSGPITGTVLIEPGPKGEDGQTGASGLNAGLDGTGVAIVQTVPNLPNGTVGEATVTQTGDAQSISFEFGVPQGIKGDQGRSVNSVTQDPVNPADGVHSSLDFYADGVLVGTVSLPAGAPGISGQPANTVTVIDDGDDTTVPTEGAVFRYALALTPGANQIITQEAGTVLDIRGSFDLEDNSGSKSFDFSGTSGDIHIENAGDIKFYFDKSSGKVFYNDENTSTLSSADSNEIVTFGDLTAGYTPLNPSGGSGMTTDPAYRGTQATNPGAFVDNSALAEVTGETAHDGQDFEFTYTGTPPADQWAIINLPNDLTDTHTVSFNFRDPISGQIVNVIDFNTYPGTGDYTTYTMSFGDTVDIITHIS